MPPHGPRENRLTCGSSPGLRHRAIDSCHDTRTAVPAPARCPLLVSPRTAPTPSAVEHPSPAARPRPHRPSVPPKTPTGPVAPPHPTAPERDDSQGLSRPATRAPDASATGPADGTAKSQGGAVLGPWSQSRRSQIPFRVESLVPSCPLCYHTCQDRFLHNLRAPGSRSMVCMSRAWWHLGLLVRGCRCFQVFEHLHSRLDE